MNVATIFITGLFAGGLTCLAVQGGLLASSLAQDTDSDPHGLKQQMIPVSSFLISRIISYTILGLFLGALGSVFQLSLNAKIILQFAVAIFMIGTALNLLEVHPIFRYFIIQPPRFLTKMIHKQSKQKNDDVIVRHVFAPGILGFMTVLIPCGATQAMMAYAVTTGSPLAGAITMFAFILGTSPLFFILGYLAKRFEHTSFSGISFNTLAAIAIIVIALFNINSALILSGSPFAIEDSLQSGQQVRGDVQNVSQATIYITSAGYQTEPSPITAKAGSKLKLSIINKDGGGCIQAFTIPKLGIQRTIPVGTSDVVTIDVPSERGTLSFMCSMGMYRGVITVD